MIAFADNSELKAIWGAEVPDVFIVGGFAVARDQLESLEDAVAGTKARFCDDPDLPVKWNLRDLRSWIEERHGTARYEAIMAASQELRQELLSHLATHEAICVVSILLGYSNRRQVLGRTKQDLIRFSFANLLMRLGFIAQERAPDRARVVLDWPDRNDRKPFVDEYTTGWQHGRSGAEGAGGINYLVGPLRELRFEQGPLFACMELNIGLQLADLVVGVTREFVDYGMGRRDEGSFGVRQFLDSLSCFHGAAEGVVVGRGLAVSPRTCALADQIRAALARHCT